MRRVFLYVFCLGLLFSYHISVRAEAILTLEDCVKTVLENNKQLRVAQEKIFQAQGRKKEAGSGYLPALTASGSYNYNHIITTVNLLGRDIELGTRESFSGRLALQQPLFAGGRIYEANRQAGIGQKMAQLDYDKTKDDLLFQVKQSFYAVLLAEQIVRISEEAYNVTQAHLKVSEALYNEGKVSRYEVNRVKVSLANQKTNVVRAVNNAKIAKDALLTLLELKSGDDIRFVGYLGMALPPVRNIDEGLAQAGIKRIELRQLELQEELQKSLTGLARSNYFPSLFLSSQFFRQDANSFSNIREWRNSWTTSITLNITLFDGLATKARVQQSEAIERQITLSKEQLKDIIKIEVKQAYFTLEQTQENLLGQSENVESAKDNMRIAQERYRLGLMSNLEVRDAQLALTQAETNFYQASYDYIIAFLKLSKAIGETL